MTTVASACIQSNFDMLFLFQYFLIADQWYNFAANCQVAGGRVKTSGEVRGNHFGVRWLKNIEDQIELQYTELCGKYAPRSEFRNR